MKTILISENTPGPGNYYINDPKLSITKYTLFKSDKRDKMVSNEKRIIPGPGTYETDRALRPCHKIK